MVTVGTKVPRSLSSTQKYRIELDPILMLVFLDESKTIFLRVL
jgi:hypothetical protein